MQNAGIRIAHSLAVFEMRDCSPTVNDRHAPAAGGILLPRLNGIDSAADSFAPREFLGLVLPDAPPDHSTISRTRRLIDLETHEAVFTWILQRLADAGW